MSDPDKELVPHEKINLRKICFRENHVYWNLLTMFVFG